MKLLLSQSWKKISILMVMLGAFGTLWAQDTAVAAAPPSAGGYATLRYSIIVVGIILIFVIMALAYIAKVTGRIYLDKAKKLENKNSPVVIATVLLSMLSLNVFAQKTEEVVVAQPLLPTDIYFYFAVIIIECLVIFFLSRLIYGFLKEPKSDVVPAFVEGEEKKKVNLLQRFFKPQSAEVQAALDLNHNYDGIRELNNSIPRWWSLAFAATILFAAVYMYRFSVSKSMPRQIEELAMANKKADEQKLVYLQGAAESIDENNVKLMVDPQDIAAGTELYVKNCVACHGDKGQGGVGPNLTDDHWLHKGGLHDVFYSIKYGWEEKGMKAWKEDFSAKQMAQLTSYIHTMKNTNVAGGKEAQGDLYVDTDAAPAAPAPDSTGAVQAPTSVPGK